ncbi:NAD(P)-binding protein [Morchella conica CCBAS932]|uniref:NAD(P)-binding protein n=1 Tax=Morchella conica CCBAS932 TaxID=1392247 RepID=A0A3N4L940_9PEZI|nr:NAD(P)-binding protein [Morchella conica CCBAS932]
MSIALKNKNVLVTGGSRGLGAATVERFAAEGCNVAINYLSASARAEALAEKVRATWGVTAVVIQGDVATDAGCVAIVEEAVRALGGLDVVVSNAGWTKIGAFSDLYALEEADWDKCWNVNAKANLHLLRAAAPTFNANPDGGSMLITSSIAATNASGSSIAYSVSKAAGLHLMRCLAASQGPKIRVNAIQPGLLLTEWGQQFPEEKIKAMKEKAALKTCPTVEECADMFVLMAKSTSLTGSSVKIDAGLFV